MRKWIAALLLAALPRAAGAQVELYDQKRFAERPVVSCLENRMLLGEQRIPLEHGTLEFIAQQPETECLYGLDAEIRLASERYLLGPDQILFYKDAVPIARYAVPEENRRAFDARSPAAQRAHLRARAPQIEKEVAHLTGIPANEIEWNTGRRDEIERALEWIGPAWAYTSQILDRLGIDPRWIWKSVPESGGDLHAVSSAACVGPLQLSKQNAVQRGLVVDHRVDERKSILRSTLAAGMLLRDDSYSNGSMLLGINAFITGTENLDVQRRYALHELGELDPQLRWASWVMQEGWQRSREADKAAAAYNARRPRSDWKPRFKSTYGPLSAEYVAKFMGVLTAVRELGIDPESYKPLEADLVELRYKGRWLIGSDIKAQWEDEGLYKILNPHLQNARSVPARTWIALPEGGAERLFAAYGHLLERTEPVLLRNGEFRARGPNPFLLEGEYAQRDIRLSGIARAHAIGDYAQEGALRELAAEYDAACSADPSEWCKAQLGTVREMLRHYEGPRKDLVAMGRPSEESAIAGEPALCEAR